MGPAELMTEVRTSDPGQSWMLEFQRGDDDAFRNIVDHYGQRVLAFFRRFGADATTAEDLTQEAFLRIARARDRYEPTAKFTTWLHRILHRMAANEGTRNRWRHSIPIRTRADLKAGEAGLPEPETEAADDPLRTIARAELSEHVRAAVADLPDSQRTALLLNRFEGASYEEVAATLDLSVPAVKSLLFRARENVKQALAPLLREEVGDELR